MSKSPSLRRIQADVRELALDPSDRYYAAPLENDMFEWHFTIRGADGTDFEGGVYHGRILLPPEYPFKPPHIMFLTPSGRFETNTKVCLSFSAYHPELWQPAWGIRLILEALISFLPTPADGAIGALGWSPKERKRLAVASQSFCCNLCGKCTDLLPVISDKKVSTSPKFSKEIQELQRLQHINEATNNTSNTTKQEETEEEETSPASLEETLTNDNQSIQEEEEEIIFETDSENGDDADDELTTPSPDTTMRTERNLQPPQPVVQQQQQQQQQQQEIVLPPAVPAPSNSSWFLDPLLNLIIALLATICFMLWNKFQALQQELDDLRAQGLLLD